MTENQMIRDDAVIDLLKWNNSLLDTLLIGIEIDRESLGRADVELKFEARPDSDFSKIDIKFTGVIEFEFSYERQDAFLNICDLKFLKLADGSFYVALDPDPATLPAAGITNVQASETDNFFVRAHHIEAIVTKKASKSAPDVSAT